MDVQERDADYTVTDISYTHTRYRGDAGTVVYAYEREPTYKLTRTHSGAQHYAHNTAPNEPHTQQHTTRHTHHRTQHSTHSIAHSTAHTA